MKKYYFCKIKYEKQIQNPKNDKVKIKEFRESFLVFSSDIENASKILKSFCANIYNNFEICDIKESNITAVIDESEIK